MKGRSARNLNASNLKSKDKSLLDSLMKVGKNESAEVANTKASSKGETKSESKKTKDVKSKIAASSKAIKGVKDKPKSDEDDGFGKAILLTY